MKSKDNNLIDFYRKIIAKERESFMQSLTLEQIAAADEFEKWLNDDLKKQNTKRRNENEQS